jgi:hypothetical protein
MSIVERLFLAAFGLIALYVFLNASEASNVIGSLGQNVGGLFGTLQGGNVTFPGTGGGQGITISRPNQNFGGF